MAAIDIWRTATLLMRLQGDDAEFAAAQNADAMLVRGDYKGCMVWISVGRAIRSLREVRPREGEMVNWEDLLHLMPHRLDRDLNVHGPFTRKAGKLKFLTGDAHLAQECRRAKESGAVLTVCLLKAEPIQDFTGIVEAVTLVEGMVPTTWDVTMTGT